MNPYEVYGKLMVQQEILQGKINEVKVLIQKDITEANKPKVKPEPGTEKVEVPDGQKPNTPRPKKGCTGSK